MGKRDRAAAIPTFTTSLAVLENYAHLHDQTIMPDDDDAPVADQDVLNNIAMGLNLPRRIWFNLSFIPIDDQQPKV